MNAETLPELLGPVWGENKKKEREGREKKEKGKKNNRSIQNQ